MAYSTALQDKLFEIAALYDAGKGDEADQMMKGLNSWGLLLIASYACLENALTPRLKQHIQMKAEELLGAMDQTTENKN